MYRQSVLTNIYSNSRFRWLTSLELLLACAITCFSAPGAARGADGGVGDGTSTAEGNNALSMLTTGTDDTGLGFNALKKNDIGVENTGVGSTALSNNTSGQQNTALGFGALSTNVIGLANTAVGAFALFSNIGNDNAAIGFQALRDNTTGHENTATGPAALGSNTTGVNNTATGEGALELSTTGDNNTADGMTALLQLSSGNNNIAMGYRAGINLTSGNNNIYIGNSGKSAESNIIRIGDMQKFTFIAGISGTAVSGSTVVVNAMGKLGVATSSARCKEQIKPMERASEAVLALKPVTFRYRKEIDPEDTPQFGLVAEDVEKVAPNLVTRDEAGKPFTVRYEAVNAMLLNEFLKEHRKVEEQAAAIVQLKANAARLEANAAEQQKQIEALTATVKHVSEQMVLTKPTSKLVGNP